MGNPYQQLHGPDGRALIRQGRTAADAPAVGAWTPDNLNAGELFTPYQVTLNGRPWETVRVTPVFTDGAGSVVNGTNVSLVPLIAVPEPLAPLGRVWRELTAIATLTDDAVAEVAVEGHLLSFRITAVTLGAATDVRVVATGGRQRRLTAGG